MAEVTKLIVDLNGRDAAILRILRDHLELPASVIVRWAIRYYALHGPVSTGWGGQKERRALLEGFGELVTGLGIKENAPCKNADEKPKTPSTRRRRSSRD